MNEFRVTAEGMAFNSEGVRSYAEGVRHFLGLKLANAFVVFPEIDIIRRFYRSTTADRLFPFLRHLGE